jgi:ribosomal protein S5
LISLFDLSTDLDSSPDSSAEELKGQTFFIVFRFQIRPIAFLSLFLLPHKMSSAIDPKNLIKRLIHVRKLSRATSGGKKRSVWALIIVGDENGTAGYGEGRANDPANAIAKATTNAIKDMSLVERLDNRTVFTDFDHTFQSVKLEIRTAAAGYGVVANNHIHEVCRCIGIRDVAVKIRGSTNPMNVVKVGTGGG